MAFEESRSHSPLCREGTQRIQKREYRCCRWIDFFFKLLFIYFLLHWIFVALCRFSLVEVFSSVTQSCLTLCDPMVCSMPGLPVHHQLLELAQSHVHRVGDAIQPSHPLSSPSPPASNLSQDQGLFKCQFFTSGGQSIGVSASASVLPMNIQD